MDTPTLEIVQEDAVDVAELISEEVGVAVPIEDESSELDMTSAGTRTSAHSGIRRGTCP
jgi:uncharacterized metal-binding protein YceD (DUF177 family)